MTNPKKKSAARSGWGGKREGAGRPTRAATPTRPRSVSLTDEEAARLREIGGGNMTEGVRRLLAGHPHYIEARIQRAVGDMDDDSARCVADRLRLMGPLAGWFSEGYERHFDRDEVEGYIFLAFEQHLNDDPDPGRLERDMELLREAVQECMGAALAQKQK
jgi:hypothetical protein